MDDADAAKLIASYIPEDSAALFGKTCPVSRIKATGYRFAVPKRLEKIR